jgi:hypothetical protein
MHQQKIRYRGNTVYTSYRHPSLSTGPVATYGSTANNQIPIAV